MTEYTRKLERIKDFVNEKDLYKLIRNSINYDSDLVGFNQYLANKLVPYVKKINSEAPTPLLTYIFNKLQKRMENLFTPEKLISLKKKAEADNLDPLFEESIINEFFNAISWDSNPLRLLGMDDIHKAAVYQLKQNLNVEVSDYVKEILINYAKSMEGDATTNEKIKELIKGEVTTEDLKHIIAHQIENSVFEEIMPRKSSDESLYGKIASCARQLSRVKRVEPIEDYELKTLTGDDKALDNFYIKQVDENKDLLIEELKINFEKQKQAAIEYGFKIDGLLSSLEKTSITTIKHDDTERIEVKAIDDVYKVYTDTFVEILSNAACLSAEEQGEVVIPPFLLTEGGRKFSDVVIEAEPDLDDEDDEKPDLRDLFWKLFDKTGQFSHYHKRIGMYFSDRVPEKQKMSTEELVIANEMPRRVVAYNELISQSDFNVSIKKTLKENKNLSDEQIERLAVVMSNLVPLFKDVVKDIKIEKISDMETLDKTLKEGLFSNPLEGDKRLYKLVEKHLVDIYMNYLFSEFIEDFTNRRYLDLKVKTDNLINNPVLPEKPIINYESKIIGWFSKVSNSVNPATNRHYDINNLTLESLKSIETNLSKLVTRGEDHNYLFASLVYKSQIDALIRAAQELEGLYESILLQKDFINYSTALVSILLNGYKINDPKLQIIKDMGSNRLKSFLSTGMYGIAKFGNKSLEMILGMEKKDEISKDSLHDDEKAVLLLFNNPDLDPLTIKIAGSNNLTILEKVVNYAKTQDPDALDNDARLKNYNENKIINLEHVKEIINGKTSIEKIKKVVSIAESENMPLGALMKASGKLAGVNKIICKIEGKEFPDVREPDDKSEEPAKNKWDLAELFKESSSLEQRLFSSIQENVVQLYIKNNFDYFQEVINELDKCVELINVNDEVNKTTNNLKDELSKILKDYDSKKGRYPGDDIEKQLFKAMEHFKDVNDKIIGIAGLYYEFKNINDYISKIKELNVFVEYKRVKAKEKSGQDLKNKAYYAIKQSFDKIFDKLSSDLQALIGVKVESANDLGEGIEKEEIINKLVNSKHNRLISKLLSNDKFKTILDKLVDHYIFKFGQEPELAEHKLIRRLINVYSRHYEGKELEKNFLLNQAVGSSEKGIYHDHASKFLEKEVKRNQTVKQTFDNVFSEIHDWIKGGSSLESILSEFKLLTRNDELQGYLKEKINETLNLMKLSARSDYILKTLQEINGLIKVIKGLDELKENNEKVVNELEDSDPRIKLINEFTKGLSDAFIRFIKGSALREVDELADDCCIRLTSIVKAAYSKAVNDKKDKDFAKDFKEFKADLTISSGQFRNDLKKIKKVFNEVTKSKLRELIGYVNDDKVNVEGRAQLKAQSVINKIIKNDYFKKFIKDLIEKPDVSAADSDTIFKAEGLLNNLDSLIKKLEKDMAEEEFPTNLQVISVDQGINLLYNKIDRIPYSTSNKTIFKHNLVTLGAKSELRDSDQPSSEVITKQDFKSGFKQVIANCYKWNSLQAYYFELCSDALKKGKGIMNGRPIDKLSDEERKKLKEAITLNPSEEELSKYLEGIYNPLFVISALNQRTKIVNELESNNLPVPKRSFLATDGKAMRNWIGLNAKAIKQTAKVFLERIDKQIDSAIDELKPEKRFIVLSNDNIRSINLSLEDMIKESFDKIIKEGDDKLNGLKDLNVNDAMTMLGVKLYELMSKYTISHHSMSDEIKAGVTKALGKKVLEPVRIKDELAKLEPLAKLNRTKDLVGLLKEAYVKLNQARTTYGISENTLKRFNESIDKLNNCREDVHSALDHRDAVAKFFNDLFTEFEGYNADRARLLKGNSSKYDELIKDQDSKASLLDKVSELVSVLSSIEKSKEFIKEELSKPKSSEITNIFPLIRREFEKAIEEATKNA